MLNKRTFIHLALIGGICFYSLIVGGKPVVAGTGDCRSCDGVVAIDHIIYFNTLKTYGAATIKLVVKIFNKTHTLGVIRSSITSTGYKEFRGEVHDCRTFAEFGFLINGQYIFPPKLKTTVGGYKTTDSNRHAPCQRKERVSVYMEDHGGIMNLCSVAPGGIYRCIDVKD